jgi:hypothetical protein
MTPNGPFYLSNPVPADNRPRNSFGVLTGFGKAYAAFYAARDKTMNFDAFEHIRTWTDPDGNGYRLELYDTYRQHRYGQELLAYQFFHKDKLIFDGADFGCSPMDAIDSDRCIAGLLSFLSLRPGDTDPEYFANYTETQHEFARSEGETLSTYAMELEESKP